MLSNHYMCITKHHLFFFLACFFSFPSQVLDISNEEAHIACVCSSTTGLLQVSQQNPSIQVKQWAVAHISIYLSIWQGGGRVEI